MKRVIGVVLLSFLLLLSVAAQEKLGNWYLGIKSGVPVGISTFSSLNEGNIHWGWTIGVFAGYRFSGVCSAELSVSIGHLRMDSQHCCEAYFLGSDGQLYFAPVAGLDTYTYPSLYSEVNTQQYSAQFNFDLLKLSGLGNQKRWLLQLSPVLSTLAGKATLRLKESDEVVVRRNSQYNFGVGGKLSVGYRLGTQLIASLYSGVDYFPGSRIDGVPKRLHRNNYIWESGLKLTWFFPASNTLMKGGRL